MSFLLGTVLLAVVTAVACALPGTFVVLRRSSMLVDAISHAALPGIVIGFILTGDLGSPLLLVGAALAGLLVVAGAEWLRGTGLLAGDSPQGLIFPALFSIGVLLVTARAAHVHLDVDAVIVGDLNLAAFEHAEVLGVPVGPAHLWLMLAVGLITSAVLWVLRPRLTLVAFDPDLARTMGLRPRLVDGILMLLVAVNVTAAFQVVGAVLVIALVVAPASTALLVTRRLPAAVAVSVLVAAVGALAGFWAAYEIGAPTSAAMSVVYGAIVLLTVGGVRLRRRLVLRRAGRSPAAAAGAPPRDGAADPAAVSSAEPPAGGPG